MRFLPRGRRNDAPPPDRSPDLQRSLILQSLDTEGCPVCIETSGCDDRFFFWFFHDHYASAQTLDGLVRSLGFCAIHGERAARDPAARSPLSVVHEILARRTGAILSRELSKRVQGQGAGAALAVPDRCPACRYRDQAVVQAAYFLAAAVEHPSGLDRYGRPGLLCLPHLRAVVPRLSQRVLRRVLTVQDAALASALESLTDPVSGFLSALRILAGDSGGAGVIPVPMEPKASPGERDPVGEFLESLSRDDACPVCREVERAWIEWMDWLDDAVPRGWDVEDILPACRDHLWAAVRPGVCWPTVQAIRKGLCAALDQVRRALETYESPGLPDDGRTALWSVRAIGGSRRRLRATLQAIGRPIPCPVCNRLAIARDRILELLFALLEDLEHRARFAGGYGLCLRHFSRALALKPSPEVRTMLTEVLAARLACLQWELEESLRKDAWAFRPEAAGKEHSAWRRAVDRFSGTLPGGGG